MQELAQISVVKIGGNVLDSEPALRTFLDQFSFLAGPKVLVHGGGKLATQLAEKLGLPQKMIQGRRVTDAETLKIAAMVYGGWINKDLVAKLQARECQSVGVTGTDADLIRSKKRSPEPVDYGFVGDVTQVRAELLENWLRSGITPVISPITHDGQGQLLNTNADTIANEVAVALARRLGAATRVSLLYSFEKPGVLESVDDPGSVIARITPSDFARMKREGSVFAGMIPKLENACRALEQGVHRVVLGQAEDLLKLAAGTAGTSVVNDG